VDYAPTSPLGTLLLAAVFISLLGLQFWQPLRAIVAPAASSPVHKPEHRCGSGRAGALLVIPIGLAVSAGARQHRFGI